MNPQTTHARVSILALALAVAMAPRPAPAEVTAQPPEELSAVHVTGTWTPLLMDVPGTASVIDRAQMDRYLVTSIRDLVRYEPGVSTVGSGGRFGLDSFHIRGLSGNRTYMEIDGVPMASSFGADIAGGGFRAGRNYLDLAQIKQVEIIRGPASALYPSDALGGAVILTTREPSDYLHDGRTTYAAIKEQYDGNDRSRATSVTLAAGDRRDGLLVSASRRVGHATGNRGTVGGSGARRTRPDPLDYHLDSLFGTWVHHADSGRSDRATLGLSRRHTRSNGLSALTVNPHENFVPDYYFGDDTDTRVRASAGQSFANLSTALADTLDWHAYWQQSRTRTETRTDTPDFIRRFRSVPLETRVFGARLLATRQFETRHGAHRLSYGAMASRTHAASASHGLGVNRHTGASGSGKPYLPGNYPLHLIPPSDTDRLALFGQDHITLWGGRLDIVPGLRWEHYAYRPGADPLYREYNPGYVPRERVLTNLSPKLGVIWHLDGALSVHADYATGFRPPLFSDIAGSWNEQPLPGFNIAYLPSPDLAAETSRNAEIGLRGQGRAGWFDVTAYYNRYRHFIWSGHQLTPSQVPSWARQIAPGAFYNLFFQAVNTDRAYVKGIEASGQLRLGAFGDALRGWSVRSSLSIARGGLTRPGESWYSPLDSVDPAKWVLGVGYDATDWGANLVATGVRRHVRLARADGFRPGGYATLDLYLHWNPVRHVALRLGATNLADRKYWDWGSLNGGTLGNLVSGNGMDDSGTGGVPADRLSMPGRALHASVRITF